jgi:hypothetical protein
MRIALSKRSIRLGAFLYLKREAELASKIYCFIKKLDDKVQRKEITSAGGFLLVINNSGSVLGESQLLKVESRYKIVPSQWELKISSITLQ